MTGPLPSAAVCTTVVADLHLDGRLADQLAPLALLDERDVVDQRERRGIATRAVHEQLERRLGALERVPAELQLLDLVGDPPRQRAVLGEVDAEGRGLLEDGAAPGLLRDHRVALVADPGRVDVLVRVRRLAHRVDVLTALVRERRQADVRRRQRRGDVGDLGDIAGDLGEARAAARRRRPAGPS